jgi:hypothetical protein
MAAPLEIEDMTRRKVSRAAMRQRLGRKSIPPTPGAFLRGPDSASRVHA